MMRPMCQGGTSRNLLWFVPLSLLLAGAWPRAADATETRASIDHVRVTGPGRHEVIVRVQDASGAPVDRLESKLLLTLDGRGVGETVTRFAAAGPRTLTVVVDAPLLRGETATLVDEVLRSVAGGLAADDRVTVVLAGDKPVARTWTARELTHAGDLLGTVAVAGGPRLFDALVLAAGKAAEARREGATAMLVLTRAGDRGSRATAEQVGAAATRGGVTSLALALLPAVDGGEGEQRGELTQLVERTGGTSWTLTPGAPLPAEFAPAVRALLDRYRMTFRARGWQVDDTEHRLQVTVGTGGAEVVAERTYRAKEVVVSSGWTGVVIAVVLIALVAAGVVFFLSRRRRQLCLLVVQGGEEDGQWYEVFDLPVRIGSARENDVVIVEDTVSRQHCMLEHDGRSIVLIDLKSEYGTWVNGARVSRHVLAEDDVLRLGTDIELAFEGR